MRCHSCSRLTTTRLFPFVLDRAPFHLHPTDYKLSLNEVLASNYLLKPAYTALVSSADGGCDLCALFVGQFKEHGWLGKIQAREAEGKATQIEIALRCFNRDESICTHGTLFITCGKTMENDWMWPHFNLMAEGGIGFMLRAVRKREARKEMVDWRLGSVEVDPDLGSQVNFALARQWLSACRTGHAQCSRAHGTFMPTRLIDVGHDESSQSPCLVTVTGEQRQYAALSHCWGGEIEFKTSQANLKHMQDGMFMKDMPPNFRDAIMIARELGFQYLWIDSLCIIQDSETDWEKEASMMGDVYANAAVTIAAAVAENSTVGILGRSEIKEQLFQINFDDASGPNDALLVFPTSQEGQRHNGEESFIKCYEEGILGSRGWTLQERVLSYRMLYYGSTQLFWSCCEATLTADGFCPELDVLEDMHLPRQLSDPEVVASSETRLGYTKHQPNVELYDRWYSLLYNYTHSRKLTKPSDKLPALSGIASLIGRLTGDHYLAGLWLGDLCRSLLWQRTSYLPCSRAEPPRAPSWSWVNFDGGVHFSGNDVAVEESLFEIIHSSAELKGANPFGEVVGGKLVLRARVLELDASYRGSLRRTKPDFATSIFDYEDTSEGSEIWGSRAVLMFAARTVDKSPDLLHKPPVNISMFGIQMPLQLGPPPKSREVVIQTLILREVDGQPDVFRRIGQAVLDRIDDTCEPGEEDLVPRTHEQSSHHYLSVQDLLEEMPCLRFTSSHHHYAVSVPEVANRYLFKSTIRLLTTGIS